MLTDAHGNGVVAIPPAPRSPYGTPAHVRGGITLTGSAPDASSADGNTTVLVLGTAFRNFGDPKCRFGTVHVPATVHHAGALSCTTPSASLVMRPPGAAYASLAEEQATLPQSCALQTTPT